MKIGYKNVLITKIKKSGSAFIILLYIISKIQCQLRNSKKDFLTKKISKICGIETTYKSTFSLYSVLFGNILGN